jgi:hypothetical protein
MAEQERQSVEVSPAVPQALGRLNVRLADFMEQINVVIKVLFEENQKFVAEFEQLKGPNSVKNRKTKHQKVV